MPNIKGGIFVSRQNFTEHLKKNENRLIVFGAGYFGCRILNSLKLNDITPVCFCDNNSARIGQEIETIKIRSFADVQKDGIDYIYIISPYEAVDSSEIIYQLRGIASDVVEYYTLQYFFLNIEEMYFESTLERIEFQVYLNKLLTKENPENLYADRLTVNVTEKCTLRCQDCCNFMPYFETQNHQEKAAILRNIDILDATFDSLVRVNILGGEPFLHPDVYDILEYIETKENIKFSVVTTNGTVVPKKEGLLKLDPKKVLIRITDYDEYSYKKDEVIQMLEECNMSYVVDVLEEWMDAAHIEYRGKNEEELKTMFRRCCMPFPELVDGNLFWCAFLSTVYRMEAVPRDQIDRINVFDDTKSTAEIKEMMQSYLYKSEYLTGCNWCKGRCRDEINHVIPAQQATEKLTYKRYPNS